MDPTKRPKPEDSMRSIRARREAREMPIRMAALEAEVAELRGMVRFLYQQMMTTPHGKPS
jgi:hypothetical protein